ncbi:MAG: hypothetical protein ACOY9Y_01005 [Bacillota bacterium]
MEQYPGLSFWLEVKALKAAGASATELWLSEDKRTTIGLSLEQALEIMAFELGSNLQDVCWRCQNLLRRQARIPLPLHREILLLPVADKGAEGYVVNSRIVMYEAVAENRGETRLFFDDGTTANYSISISEFRQLITEGQILHKAYWGLYLISNRGDSLKEVPVVFYGMGKGGMVNSA